MLRIDSHHHLWLFNAEEFPWLEGELANLRRDFLAAQLVTEMEGAGVCGTVAVQARQTLDETDFLLTLGEAAPFVRGVVGWLPLCQENIGELIDQYRQQSLLRGLRHVIQAEAVGFMDSPAFRRGIRAMQGTDLVYDILLFERQMREALRLVDAFPQQRFILDHIGKPSIREGSIKDWTAGLRELAKRPNIACKISGMVTEADPRNWSAEQLKPYFDVVLNAFQPNRLMIGTDWPVMLAGCSYRRWWTLVEQWINPLSTTERSCVLGSTAVEWYGLSIPDEPGQQGGGAV